MRPCPLAPVGPACPYDLDTIPDLPTLLWRHQQYQTAVLLGDGAGSGSSSSSSNSSSRPRAQVVVVTSNDLVGLGNRVPAVVTGEGAGCRPCHHTACRGGAHVSTHSFRQSKGDTR
jgi:hypothetical protein